MVEPAHKYNPSEKDYEDKFNRPNLRTLEGGGEGGQPSSRSNLKAVPAAAQDIKQLKGNEDNVIPGPWVTNVSPASKNSAADKTIWWKKKKFVIPTSLGITGLAGTAGIMFFLQGPLQFIHFAQFLSRIHLETHQDAADGRFTRIARYIHHKTDPEKTRLGYLGNRYANKIEARINKTGLQSAYTPRFGAFNGYIFDPAKAPPELAGKTQQEIKDHYKNKYGVNLVEATGPRAGPGRLQVDMNNTSYREFKKISTALVKGAGVWKMPASIQARVMGFRAGVTWHPIGKWVNKTQSYAEKALTWRKKRESRIRTGESVRFTTVDGITRDENGRPVNSDAPGEASAAEDSVNNTQNEADAAKKDGKLSSFKSSLGLKIGLGGASAIGAVCIAKATVERSEQIDQAQRVLPMMRLGMEAVTTGFQIMSGIDADMEILGIQSQQLFGKSNPDNPKEKETSWSSAESILAEQGKTGGKPIDAAAKTPPDSSLSFLKDNKAVGAVCSTGGTVALTAISLAGGPVSAAMQAVVGYFAAPYIVEALAGWATGEPVDINAKGADYGSLANYGTRYAANDVAISAGGKELTGTEVAQLKQAEAIESQDEFNQKSLASRIFDPIDERSLVSQFIDSQPNSTSTGASGFAKAIFSSGSNLASMTQGRLFSSANAAPTHKYGFGKYGFSQDELARVDLDNPMDNAEKTAAILNGSRGDAYIDRAEKCFGMKIAKDSAGRWGVTTGKSVPKYEDIKKQGNCGDQGTDWLRVRFFVFDTGVMEAMSCFEGEEEACRKVGFNQPVGASDTPSDSQLATGSAKELATQVANNPNIELNSKTKQGLLIFAEKGTVTGQCGDQITVNPVLTGALQGLSSQYKIRVNNIGINGDRTRSIDGDCSKLGRQHRKGNAVDLSRIDIIGGKSTGGISFSSAQIPILEAYAQDFVNLLPPTRGGVGQKGCGAFNITPPPGAQAISGAFFFEDRPCNHLHIDVRDRTNLGGI